MQNKVEYWLELCNDDLRAAKNLLASKDYLWMSFICHLIVEKAIKAVIGSIAKAFWTERRSIYAGQNKG